MKTIYLPLLFLFIVVGCNRNNSQEELDAQIAELAEELAQVPDNSSIEESEKGNFTLRIPNDLTITDDLNDDASLQYSNLYKEQYVIGLETDKHDFIELLKANNIDASEDSLAPALMDIQLNALYEDLEVIKQSERIHTVVNEMTTEMVAIDAKFDGIDEDISYWIACYTGNRNMFTVMVWTIKNDKNSFEKEANAILKSMEEVY